MKRYVFVFILLMLLFSANKLPKNYIIEGQVTGIPDSAKIYLLWYQGNVGKTIDTAIIIGGKFRFEGVLDEVPAKMGLWNFRDKRFFGNCSMWIGEGVTKVTGHSFGVSGWVAVNDLEEQKQENRFCKNVWHQQLERDSLYQLWYQAYFAKNKTRMDSLDQIVDVLYRQITRADLEMIKKETITQAALERLYRIALGLKSGKNAIVTRDEVEKQYLRLSDVQKKSLWGESIRLALNPPETVKVGDQMADGILRNLEGKTSRLSDYKGKYMLLDFWSCGCGPCLQAGPELKEVAELHKDSLHVISVSVDVSEKMWREASKEFTWINLSDLKGDNGIVALYGVRSYPQFMIIDPDGKIAYEWSGYGKGIIKMQLNRYWKKKNDGSKN